MFGEGIEDFVKAEKERAMRRYRRLRRAAALSRCLLEAVAAFALLSWSSARLPASLSLFAALRHLPTLLFHPLSAFLLGNAIIVTLVAKSNDPAVVAASPPPSSSAARPASPAARADGARSRCYVYLSPRQPHEANVVLEDTAVYSGSVINAVAKKGMSGGQSFARTSSMDSAAASKKETAEELLRRTQSDAGVGTGEKAMVERWEVEEEQVDDSEEFRRKIESFISRQMRSIEREEASLLLAAQAASIAGVAAVRQSHHGR